MQISVKDYVARKYNGRTKALMKAEACCFGIKYPLPNGWFDSGARASVSALKTALGRIRQKSASYASAQAGLACLADMVPQKLDGAVIDAPECGILGSRVDVFGVEMTIVHIVDAVSVIVADSDGWLVTHKITDVRLL